MKGGMKMTVKVDLVVPIKSYEAEILKALESGCITVATVKTVTEDTVHIVVESFGGVEDGQRSS